MLLAENETLKKLRYDYPQQTRSTDDRGALNWILIFPATR
jgi:hypothetical protein